MGAAIHSPYCQTYKLQEEQEYLELIVFSF